MNEAFTAAPAPRKAVSITAEELLSAITQFLAHHGISVGGTTLDPVSGAGTSVTMVRVSENGTPWEAERAIFFDVTGKGFRSLTSRIGAGPFPLFIQATRTMAEAKRDEPCRLIADVVAVPNPDRSVSFLPVKRREGDLVYF